MLSRTARHAAAAVIALAEMPPGDYAGAGEIADQIKAPRNYLGKLLKILADEGVLESQKGKGGGFRLAREAERITLFDVVEPIDHVSRWGGCLLGGSRCSDETPCAVHFRWAGVRDVYLKFLKGTTVADLAAQPQLSISVP
ncbi:MAG: Rrf2 family transcriptional regulator [Pirellulales bacterium]|nr:Rrf2 family transcriptional regulator [Pirellulales bacterium]